MALLWTRLLPNSSVAVLDLGCTHAWFVMVASIEFRGTIAIRHEVIGPPANVTALALTSWSDSFIVHGIQALPTPPPSGRVPPMNRLDATTDTGSVHQNGGGGGHGHPRFLWHLTFTPTLASRVGELNLSGTTANGAIATRLQLPHWPPVRHHAPTEEATSAPRRATRRPDQSGQPLPDRVVPISADLGVIAGVRRALTSLYCWSTWFLMTVEAAGDPLPIKPGAIHEHSWEMEDDRGNEYLGARIGGWSGSDNGVHVAFAPGLDPEARQLRLSFTDPFGRATRLTTLVTMPTRPRNG
jgi:hypothetical protein